MNPVPNLPLKDIHLPPPVGWWPPAPGWWLLLLLGLLLAGLGYRRWRKHADQRRLLVAARRSLDAIEREYQQGQDGQRLAAELSTLLRRIAMTLDSREQVAGLTGEQWLAYLDRQTHTRDFSQGPGRVLLDAPYQFSAAIDAGALLALARRWLDDIGNREAAD